MRRGDLLVLSNRTKQLHCGDIVVYKVQNREIPIVHRIIEVSSYFLSYPSDSVFARYTMTETSRYI